MKLTQNMVDKFNNYVSELNTTLMLVYLKDFPLPAADIISTDRFVSDETTVNVLDGFYDILEIFFEKKYGVRLVYNNTKTTLWISE